MALCVHDMSKQFCVACARAETAAVQAKLDKAEADVVEAREVARRVVRQARILTCVYCGHEYPEGTPPSGHQALTDHIRECPKHPMRELEAQVAALTEGKDRWEREAHEAMAAANKYRRERDDAISLRDAIAHAKAPASSDQLIMAEMDAAVARTERDCAHKLILDWFHAPKGFGGKAEVALAEYARTIPYYTPYSHVSPATIVELFNNVRKWRHEVGAVFSHESVLVDIERQFMHMGYFRGRGPHPHTLLGVPYEPMVGGVWGRSQSDFEVGDIFVVAKDFVPKIPITREGFLELVRDRRASHGRLVPVTAEKAE